MRIRLATVDDIDGIAHVHVAGWRDNYRGMLPDAILAEKTFEFRQAFWKDLIDQPDRITFVAEEQERIVGFVSAIPLNPTVDGFTAFLPQLFIMSEAKAKGLGRALLRAIATALIERGCTNLVLRTLRLNPARGFYERLGARLVPEGIPIDASQFDDVVYAFDDLTKFVNEN